MSENGFKLILDRAKHEGDAIKVYSKQIETLTELVDYGTNMIRNTYEMSNKKLADIIIIGVLLKQVILMADACSLLISKGAVSPAYLQARAAFEASLYMDWMFKGESEKKAKYYYVWNLRTTRLQASKLVPGTPENTVFDTTIQKELKDFIPNMDDLKELAINNINEIDALLKKPAWVKINIEFVNEKGKRIEYEPEWYKVLEKKLTIRKLAKSVERLAPYYLFYSRGSDIMHVSTYTDHIMLKKGQVLFEPIRQLKEAQAVFSFVFTTVVHTYRSVLQYYGSPELKSFRQKYMSNWRDSILHIPSVTYSPPKENASSG